MMPGVPFRDDRRARGARPRWLSRNRIRSTRQRVIDELPLRNWLAVAIAVATVAAVLLLSWDAQVALVAAAGVLVLVVIVMVSTNERAETEEAPPAPALSLLPAALEAIAEPVLVVRAGRVIIANTAACHLLGQHIGGEDVRVAIRHPAAAEFLLDDHLVEPGRPVDLVGLGTLEQRWRMHVTMIGEGMRLVHLVDQTGQYAAERMRVDFVANASHELRTPLSSILGYVETLADAAGEDPAIRQRFLGIVFDEARRMERLVEDLMSLSRIEAEKFRLPAEAVDLAALAAEVCDSLRNTHGPRGGDVMLEAAALLPPVTGDRAQLSQLLHNLIGNAMKYGRAGTPVEVSLSLVGGSICLVVADQGEGIAPEHLPRLTERFYRVDAARSRGLGGTGLGLAIVKHIVERHRGRLDIASALGRGTRVSVALPAATVIKP